MRCPPPSSPSSDTDLAVVTNHPEHDPDIQHIPFFAISKEYFSSLWSTYYKRVMALDGFSKVMISVQYVIYTFTHHHRRKRSLKALQSHSMHRSFLPNS